MNSTSCRRLAAFAVALIAAAGLTACSSPAAPAKAGTCLAPIAAPVPSSVAIGTPSPEISPGVGVEFSDRVVTLPAVKLACLDGSGDVALTSVRAPMMISLWGSWCAPCRAELPTIESFAKAASGQMAVVGVDTADETAAGRSMATDFGLGFPQVQDPDTALIDGIGAPHSLPMLLFVRDGRVVLRYSSNQVDSATLTRFASEYLGVQVRFQ